MKEHPEAMIKLLMERFYGISGIVYVLGVKKLHSAEELLQAIENIAPQRKEDIMTAAQQLELRGEKGVYNKVYNKATPRYEDCSEGYWTEWARADEATRRSESVADLSHHFFPVVDKDFPGVESLENHNYLATFLSETGAGFLYEFFCPAD